MELLHGGDWAGYESTYGKKPLDFSANVSPLGLPEAARQAAVAALAEAGRYPDPLCRKLREALAARHGVPAERIVCGNGASDLIYRLPLALKPKNALVLAPGFAEYERALSARGCRVRRHMLSAERDFAPGEDLLQALTPELDLLFLCQPNNPTGRLLERGLLEAVWERCQNQSTVLVLDECFLDFLENAQAYSLAGHLNQGRGLVILRAFTKSCAMAGLRLGYALCADPEAAEKLALCGPPWSVSLPAQAAGLAALADEEYAVRLRKLMAEERPRLLLGLSTLGLRVIPGEANFLLFFCPDAALGEKLRARGILIRNCANFPGLGKGWYRTAVRTGPENQRLLNAMGEVLTSG